MVERIKNGKKLIMLDTINSNSKADSKFLLVLDKNWITFYPPI